MTDKDKKTGKHGKKRKRVMDKGEKIAERRKKERGVVDRVEDALNKKKQGRIHVKFKLKRHGNDVMSLAIFSQEVLLTKFDNKSEIYPGMKRIAAFAINNRDNEKVICKISAGKFNKELKEIIRDARKEEGLPLKSHRTIVVKTDSLYAIS